jgi:hypothetical protein
MFLIEDITLEVLNVRMERLRKTKYPEYFKILYLKYQNTIYQKRVLVEC